MTGTTHALAGAAVGSISRNARSALLTGLVSHAFLDILPHRDYDHGLRGLVLDGMGVIATLALARSTGRIEALAGAVGGVLPDLEHARGGANPHRPAKLFPSHWIRHERGAGQSCVAAELAVAGTAILILLATAGRR